MNEVTTADRIRAVAIAVIVHVAMLLLLLFLGLNATIPPTSDAGILINFGTDLDGQGRLEPATDVKVNPSMPQVTDAADKENLLTQDFEEAPAIEKQKVKKKPVTEKPTPKTEKTAVEVKTEQKSVEPQQKVNQKALFPGKKSDGGDQGEGETGKAGNQGDPNGSPLSGNRIGGGNGNGNIPSFSLAGRGSLTLPTPKYSSQSEGKVVVEITVDREGNVVKANPTIKGSTVQDDKLFEAAKDAAMKAKFNVKSDAPAYQVGTITYNFRLQ